ncbi:helix-turn-helix domain-containing protein [Paenibacillus sp. NPDC058177]|uniref:helix-turn-helix domain-containing protein n=1 Tax=Paenibacillus sp. NPDC058177 TaxID=3346369 RepID=UPI0036DDC50D
MELVPVRCRIPELLVRRANMEPPTSPIKINQQWLADSIDMSKQQLSDYINLRRKNMRLQKAHLIAYYLDCLVDDLYVMEWR